MRIYSEQKNRKGNRGFTMAESLVVVAIIVALLTLAVPGLIRLRLKLRQKELDSKAEIIYTAAQNQLSKLRASGHQDGYTGKKGGANGVYKADYYLSALNAAGDEILIPSDMLVSDDDPASDIYYISRPTAVDDAALLILPEGSADANLLSQSWVVEFDPESASVYAVFYQEDGALDFRGDITRLDVKMRDYTNRLNDGAHVGYYGGDSATIAATKKLEPHITVYNREVLAVVFECRRIGDVTADMNDLIFSITLTDESGNIWEHTVIPADMPNGNDGVGDIWVFGTTNRFTLVMDDLRKDETRFFNKFGILNPGENITVKVTVSCNNPLIEEGTATEVTNSLFDDSSAGGSAVITTARHLQNLDESSGVMLSAGSKSRKTSITSAVQQADISFYNDPDNDSKTNDWEKDWYDLYNKEIFAYYDSNTGTYTRSADSACFTPINNSLLKSYTGSYDMGGGKIANTVIYGLHTVVDQPAAGLFGTVGNTLTLTGVRLSGTTAAAAADGSAGAFAGRVTGTLIAEKCLAYLTKSQSELDGQVTLDTDNKPTAFRSRITGANAGGFVGSAEGVVQLTNCSASTLVGSADSAANAGGLIGSCGSTSTVILEGSYADCYVHGANVGGLIGKASGSAKTVNNSYAAGYLYCDTNGTAAGLVNGQAQLKNSYTAVAVDGTVDTLYYTAAASSTAANTYHSLSVTGSCNKRYQEPGEDIAYSALSDRETMADTLGTAFTRETGGYTTAYNLLNQGLEDYSFPRLAALHHYGDWSAGFESGKLVYFEKYTDGTFGFFGANTDSLRRSPENVVVGDGYGIAFDDDPTGEKIYLRYTTASGTRAKLTVEASSANVKEVTTAGEKYYILTLPNEITNSQYVSPDFYQKVEIMDGSDTNAKVKSSYWFNPHFAQTAVSSDSDTPPELEKGAIISIRSARQLNNLALYYEKYQTSTKNCEFLQEQDIDYSKYEWTEFAGKTQKVTSQIPIGNASIPFVARYNGNYCTVRGVSFMGGKNASTGITDTLDVGFFGVNAGIVTNVVLVGGYDGTRESGSTVGSDGLFQELSGDASAGVLAGTNTGTIRNCAVTGFNLNPFSTYIGSNVALGGLVGRNKSTIANCGAETPVMNINANEGKMKVGGLVGENAGAVTDCYAIASIDAQATTKTTDAVGNSVKTVFVGGLAGNNDSGSLRNSYCAVNMSTGGGAGQLYALAPFGGSLSSCYYLNKGTFQYVNDPGTYNADTNVTDGAEKTFDELSGTGVKAVENTFSNGAYPFPAKVTDRNGNPIHYGSWPYEKDMGIVGVVYWEHETSGSNNGYKFTMIGYNAARSGTDKTEVTSTLCVAHDDGGNVAEYGYGYYFAAGRESSVTFKSHPNTDLGSPNTAAEDALETLLPQYGMVLYTTGESSGSLRLNKDDLSVVQDTWTFDLAMNENGKSWTDTYKFTVSPFFGNSLSFDTTTQINDKTKPFSNITDAGKLFYAQPPGTADHPYEVRSVQQLRFINWNCNKKNTTTWEEANTYDKFPYLMKADSITSTTVQKNPGQSTGTNKNKLFYWEQTHDLQGDGVTDYVPIAAHGGHNTSNSYDVYVYGWFGGSYDGGTYTIRNLNITSGCYAVGLFSVTVGADFKNVVLYSDQGSVIERSGCKAVGAYSIGGLIGLALDYTVPAFDNTISNCAIAGYTLRDKSDKAPSMGECNMGGLIGIAKVKLLNCTAVTDIDVQPQYNLIKWSSWETDPNTGMRHPTANSKNTNDTSGNFPSFGMYLRIGGLTGANQKDITNCYTGGSITVSDDVRYTTRKGTNAVAYGGSFEREKSFNCYIGGISSSEYTPLLKNINGISGSDGVDGESLITNCYTYMEFPPVGGTVLAVSMLGSVADRYYGINTYGFRGTDSAGKSYKNAGSMVQNNCYYFDYSASNINLDTQAYTMKGNKKLNSTFTVASGVDENAATRLKYMLGGRLCAWRKWVENSTNDVPNTNTKAYGANAGKDSSLPQAVDKDTMEGTGTGSLLQKLGSAFSKVTTTDKRGGNLDGKYSFPGNDTSLLGTNYPYPTVLTQTDRVTGETVHVHYGRWVVSQLMWDRAMNSMDIFSDMVTEDDVKANGSLFENSDVTWACKILTLSYKGGSGSSGAGLSLTVDDPSVLKVEEVKFEGGVYYVKVTAKKPGSTTITADDGSGKPCKAHMEITAELSVSVDPTEITLRETPDAEKNKATVTLQATDKAGERNYSDWSECSWKVTDLTENLVVLSSNEPMTGEFDVEGWFSGETMIRCDCIFNYHDLCRCSGTAFTHVLVKEASKVGLSNGSAFNEAMLRTGKKTVPGSGASYAKDKTGKLIGPMPVDAAGTAIGSMTVPYLYGIKEDSVLDADWSIEEITLGGENVYRNGQVIPSEKYAISLDTLTSDDTYNYITLHPATILDEDQTNVPLVVLIAKGDTKYELKVNVTAIASPHMTVLFYEQESDPADAYVKKLVVVEANKNAAVTLPTLTHSDTLHASFLYWHFTYNGTAYTKQSGSKKLPYQEGTLNVYADWEADWKVTYETEYGTAPAMAYVECGKSIKLPAIADQTERRHTGWSIGGKTYDKGTDYTPTANVTLNAVWKPLYTVTLVSTVEYGSVQQKAGVQFDGKTYYSTDANPTIRVAEGQKLSIIDNTAEHYTFLGWIARKEGSTSDDFLAVGDTYTVTGNTTLTADWEKWYELHLNPNGGKLDGSIETKSVWVKPGNTFTFPDLGVQNWGSGNFRHTGWGYDNSGNPILPGGIITPTGEMRFDAGWNQVFIVTFKGDGGKSADNKAQVDFETQNGDQVTIPAFTYEHYKLTGWMDDQGRTTAQDGTAYQSGNAFYVYSDLTLTAQWQPYWVIQLLTDGGTISGNAKNWVCPGEDYTTPDGVWEHHKLTGWVDESTNPNTIYGVGAAFTPDKNVTLKAQWLADYVVTLDTQNGTLPSGSENPIYVTPGAGTTLPTPTRAYYKFLGWSDGTNTVTGSFTPDGDVTLTAQWQPYWKVTLSDSQNAYSGENPIQVEPGQSTTLPTPAKTFYNFRGWSTDGTKPGIVGADYTPTADVPLYAVWDPWWVINLNTDGGTLPSGAANPDHVDPDTGTAALPVPTKEHNSFLGWLNGSSRVTGSDGVITGVTSDLDLKAEWQQLWNLTLDANGGKIGGANTKSIEVEPNVPVDLSSYTPTRSGYRFVGWNTSGKWTDGCSDSYTPTANNQTVKACWRRIITVTFDLNVDRWHAGTNPISNSEVTVGNGISGDALESLWNNAAAGNGEFTIELLEGDIITFPSGSYSYSALISGTTKYEISNWGKKQYTPDSTLTLDGKNSSITFTATWKKK